MPTSAPAIELDDSFSSAPSASAPAIEMDDSFSAQPDPAAQGRSSAELDRLSRGPIDLNARLQHPQAPAAVDFGARKPNGTGQSEGGQAMEQFAGPGAYRLNRATPQTLGQEINPGPAKLQAVSTDETLAGQAPQPDMHEEGYLRALSGTPLLSEKEQAAQEPGVEAALKDTPGGKIIDQAGRVAGAPQEFIGGTEKIANAIDNDEEQAPGQRVRQAAQGGTQALGGAMDAGIPLFASAALQAPIKLAVGYAAGMVGGWTAEKAAQLAGAPPEVQEFAKTAGFFFPTAIATFAGLQSGASSTPGVEGGGVSAFDGRVQAAAGRTPEAYGAGVRIGGKQISINIPRGGAPEAPAQLPSPAQVVAGEQASNAMQEAAHSAALDEAATKMVAGVPAPPKPPLPGGMDTKNLTPDVLQQAAKIVQLAPPEARAQMLIEAHAKLADWMSKSGSFVGPDGQVHTAITPQKAQTLAEKYINDTVKQHQDSIQAMKDERQRQMEEVAKQQEKAQQDAEKAAADAQKKAEEQKEKGIDTSIEQRAKTVLDSNPEITTDDHRSRMLQQRLGVSPQQAGELLNGYKNPPAPSVGGPEHEVPEEPPSQIDAQLRALQAGTTKVVMLPEGSSYKPQLPQGMKQIDVKGDVPGAGTYIYDPTRIRAATIKEAAKAGTHGDLLGHVHTKEEVEASKAPTIVTAHDPQTGAPIQDSAVDATRPGAIDAQSQVLQERHPGATIQVKPAEQAITERAAQHIAETQPKPQTLTVDRKMTEMDKMNYEADKSHYRPLLSLDTKEDTGWRQLRLQSGYELIDPTNDRMVQFHGGGTGTGMVRAGAEAHAFAIDNPIEKPKPEVTDTDHYHAALEETAPGKKMSELKADEQRKVLALAQQKKDASGGKDVFDQVASDMRNKVREQREMSETGKPPIHNGRMSGSQKAYGPYTVKTHEDGSAGVVDANGMHLTHSDFERAQARARKWNEEEGHASNEVEKPEVERRTDTERRIKVGEMSPEEMRKELLTSDKVPLPNRRAFDESGPSKVVGMSDADGLKAMNDKFGYEAGDALLKAKAEALREAGLDAYHDKGDEFLFRGNDAKELKTKLQRASEILQNRIIEVTTNDGQTLQFKGANFSFGVGSSLGTAETGLKQHKADREARGERARGELRGITETRPEKSEESESAPEQKYSFGSTQHTLDKSSPAAKSVEEAQKAIKPEDLAGKGLDVGGSHVTVRYGIQGEDTAGIRAFLEKQSPFEARLQSTQSFPPSKNSDGAAVIMAPVVSSALHAMNAEIAKHGDFKESDFPDYRPHVTVAYVKPEAAAKYTKLATGGTFHVDSIEITNRDGKAEVVKLKGDAATADISPETSVRTSDQEREKLAELQNDYRAAIAQKKGSAEIERLTDAINAQKKTVHDATYREKFGKEPVWQSQAPPEKLKKGDRAVITDKGGVQREGNVVFTGDRMTRLRGDDGKEYTVTTGKVKGVTDGEPAAAPASVDQTGGGRPAAEPESSDRAGLAEVSPSVLPEPGAEGNTPKGDSPDSLDVRGDTAPVPESGAESRPGQGSDTGLDNSPAGPVAEAATKALAKPKALNRGWYAHPDNWTPPSGTVGRLEANLKAIRILRDVEKSPRKLTEPERDALANYVGWGALQHAFNPYGAPRDEYSRWSSANSELQKLLSPDELARAQESTKNAHYTSPELVRFMWDTMQRMGFKAGTVFEPSVGTGNFLGMMPKAIRAKSNAVANELDTTSHAIAKLLYPEATIFNKDFADLILPDNDVDLAIGNPPFGAYKLYDPKYKSLNANIHDFFFVKSLDKVRPGGVLAFITSTGTMDKANSNIRTVLASKGNFLGAMRLPSGAFKANAGTDVTTDLIFFQKRAPGEAEAHVAPWINSPEMKVSDGRGSMETLNVNEYFQAHPEMMLGNPTASTKMYGSVGFVLELDKEKNLKAQLAEAQKAIPRGIYREDSQAPTGSALAQTAAEFAPDNIKDGQYIIDPKGNLKQRIEGKLVAPEAVLDKAGKPQPAKVERFKALVGVRERMNELLTSMVTAPDDEHGNALVAQQRGKLEKQYNVFVKEYGFLNGVANNSFRDDPHYPRLLALENWDKANRVGTPADILRKRTIFPREQLTALPSDPKAALQLILAERGFPDVAMMARLRGENADTMVAELKEAGLIWRNPSSGAYETRETYLSGYVRDKLRDAERAVKQGLTEYEPNVKALKDVVPADIEIGPDPKVHASVRLGSTWIPTEAIESFIKDEFRSPGQVKYVQGVWQVSGVRPTAENMGIYGTPRISGDEILAQTLNLKQVTINDRVDDKLVLNQQETTAAQAKQEQLRQAFQKWASESKWKPELQKLYNNAYNNLAQVEYNGSHLTFPGMNPAIKLNTHQVNAVWRILQDGRALLAHDVGAGKTFEMQAAVMEGRRVGTFKKPMMTVPNHIVEQFRQEFLHLYPGANLLVPTEKDFDSKNRQRIMSRIATGDYDAVILPHSQFNLMDISPARQRVTIQKQKDELFETIQALKSDKGDKRTIKQLETAAAKLDAKLKALSDLKADKAINFDDLGVDALFVDEAHLYKNLTFYTKMTRISGLQQATAKSALRLKMKTEFLQDRNSGRGVIFATGTPVQNTMAELYTMFKYVAPDVLEKAGINFFDDWAANFGSVITAMELAADGRSYKARSKFAQFQNVPELMNMFRSFADIKTKEDLNLPTPELESGKPIVVSVPASDVLEEYVKDLMARAERVKGGQVDPRIDNMLKITTDGRKAATDMRLINADLPDDAGSKINMAIEKMFQEWQDGKDATEGPLTQMAFLDLYRSIEPAKEASIDGGKQGATPEKELINLYTDMREKLVKLGVPRDQVAVIGEHDTRVKRQALFAQVNRGEVRILLGSTQKMGAGTNAQRLLKALHHIDLTWRPGDLAQRNGRIERQGNLNKSIRIYNYLTERSFDAYMAQTLQGKAEFISQVFSGRSKERVMADAASEMVLSLEEMKIAASGNPDVKKQYDLQMRKAQLLSLARSYESQKRNNIQQAQTELERADRYEASAQKMTDAAERIAKIEGTDPEEKGIKVWVDGKTFTDRAELGKYLEAMELPEGNFHLTWNDIGVAVEQREQTAQMKANAMSGVAYTLDYLNNPFPAPQRSMASLARSIEARLRTIKDDADYAEKQVPVAREKAKRLAEIAEKADFPEADELKKVEQSLKEVETRLGMRSDVENAMAQAVSAEVDNDPEPNADEGDEEDEPEETDIDKAADKAEVQKPRTGGTTMRASVFGLDIAAEFAAKQGAAFYKADVAPALAKFGTGAKSAGQQILKMLYPRLGVNADALDAFFNAKGMREQHRFELEHVNGGLEKLMDKLGRDGNIDFMDRKRQGRTQVTPELQKVADLMDSIGGESFKMVQEFKPSLAAKEHYYGAIWKVVPGSGKTSTGNASGRRPFQGAKQFFKQQTLETISEGIANGGELPTYNAWKLFSMVEATKMHYIAAQTYWRDLKDLGLRKYVKRGERAPEGWAKIDDSIAKVYFPATVLDTNLDSLGAKKLGPQKKEYVAKEDIDTHGEMLERGEWYVEEGAARILNNYLSRDLIRNNAIGKGMLAMKNFTTAVELALSPFHLLSESVRAIGGQMSIGMQRFVNIGVKQGSAKDLAHGGKDFAMSLAAPFLLARDGGSYLRSISSAQDFAKTRRGMAFFKKFPDALDGMVFKGGAQFNMNPDYRFDPEKSLTEAIKQSNYVGAALRLLPAAQAWLMKPLFDVFIPRLKLGFLLNQMAEQADERAQELVNGDTTRLEIARQANDVAENAFGELNFDNIAWNNTFKTTMQFFFRSVTWHLGDWRTAAKSVHETAESFRDPLHAFHEAAKGRAKTSDFVPHLGMNQALLLGLAIATATIGTAIAKMASGKYPWQWMQDDRRNGYSAAGSLLLETLHPRTGKEDEHGQPERLNIPNGFSVYEHAWRDPAGYAKSTQAGLVSRMMDVTNNRDYFGNYIYDPNALWFQQAAQAVKYAIPQPMALASFQQGYGSQDATSKTLRAVGLGGASKSLDQSPLLQHMLKMKREKKDPLTPDQVKEFDEQREAPNPHKTRAQIRRAMKERNMDYVEKLAMGRDFSYIDLREMVDKYATPEEQSELTPILMRKRAALLRKGEHVAEP
jgi:N12 class adenine-specific DNA methylase/GGDEF domain-containing protein/2'-5' RNA ligase